MNRFFLGAWAALLVGIPRISAFQQPARAPLPDFDRREPPAAARALPPEQLGAEQRLRERLPGLRVTRDERIGSPKSVVHREGFLTGPAGVGRAVEAGALPGFAANDPHRVTKAFLSEHAGVFGHGPEALGRARLRRDYVTPHNGLKTTVWAQEVDGVPVFGAVFISHVTARGELVNVSSQFLPDPARAAAAVAGPGALRARPTISARAAVARAAETLGERIGMENLAALDAEAGPVQRQFFTAAQLRGRAAASLVWLPVSGEVMRLCWDVTLAVAGGAETYRVLIGAETGEALWRRCLTRYLSPASYRVFTSDSPSPFSPGHGMPSTNQPPLVARSLVTFSALNTNASPEGWIRDGDNETRGNNVDAHSDVNDDDFPDLPRPQGALARTFDFALDLTQPPATYRAASVVQLFYWCNWAHDRLYELGFTEASGNFQTTNFGRGGLGNDAVLADAQDGGGFNNANFSPAPDGDAPRIQMYLFNGPTPDRDGDFDAEIVLHEYVHGLSERLVGGGVGIFALQSSGLGEGWSDFYSLALLGEAGDDLNGNYAHGAYATRLYRGLNENFYFGIRRFPYSTDLTKNPLTLADIDPSQAAVPGHVPLNPSDSPFNSSLASEVHNQGEVWCVTLWEARANLIRKHGFPTGNELMLQLATDGMKLGPANPTFLEARDAILQADLVNHGGANGRELWAAFAKRGMGLSATSPPSWTTFGVFEAFDVPDPLAVSPTSAGGRGPVGGPFSPASTNFSLFASGTNPVSWRAFPSVNWLAITPTNGTLAGEARTNLTVTLTAAALSLPMGVFEGTVVFSNLTTGVAHERRVTLRVGQPDHLTELFSANDADLAFQTFTFTLDGSSSYYSVCREPAAAFPTDPTGGTVLSVSDDSQHLVRLSGSARVSLYGRNCREFWVGANGYITLGQGDGRWIESFAAHFELPRIAALFDDLSPQRAGATVSWRQLTNRVAVSYESVSEIGTSSTNSFQIEMFFDGTIRLTYLQIDARDGLVGLSRGEGVPASFIESDFSSFGSCGALPPARYRLVEAESATLTPPMARLGNATAYGGTYVATPTNSQGSASFTVNIPVAGTYAIWCRVLAPSPQNDSFVVSVDGGPTDIYDVAEGTPGPGWQWSRVNGRGSGGPASINPRLFNVAAGNRTIRFNGRDPNTGLDRLILTTDLGFRPVSPLSATMLQPTNGARLSGTFLISLLAQVGGGEGCLTNVTFFDGTNRLGQANESPLDFYWRPTAGFHLLFAQARDDFGGVANSAPVNVEVGFRPQFVSFPRSATVNAGMPVTFSAGVTGTSPVRFEWRREAVVIPGATNATLTLANTQLADEGQYTVGASNAFGTASAFASLTVLRPGLTQAWVRSLGGNARAMKTDAAGNIYVTGLISGTNSWDILTSKMDPNGNTVWTTRYDGGPSVFDFPTSLALDAAGNVFVGGGSSNDFLTLKLSSNGTLLWARRYDGPGHDSEEVADLAVDRSGNVIVTGESLDTNFDSDFATVKYAANGNRLWVARFDGGATRDAVPTALAVDNAGNVHVTGQADRVGSGVDMATVTYDASGNPLWVAYFTGTNASAYDEAQDVVADGAGNVYVTGSAYFDATGNDFVTIKYASNGLALWVARYDGPGSDDDVAGHVALDASGGVVVAGSSYTRESGQDFLIVRYHASGQQDWVARYNDSSFSYDSPTDLATNAVGNIFVTGESSGRTRSSDFATLRLNASGHRLRLARFNGAGDGFDFPVAVGLGPGGVFYVTGSTDSEITTVKYQDVPLAGRPLLTLLPTSQSVLVGSNVTLTASATGNAPLSFQWHRNGAPIPEATNAFHSIANVQFTHVGEYSVEASNSLGAVHSPVARLTLNLPPAILRHPADQLASVGGGARFDVNATGPEPLTYQWRFEGGPIPGATNAALLLTGLTLGEGGSYDVIVRNPFGSVTSLVARLTVVVCPALCEDFDPDLELCQWFELTPAVRATNYGGSVSGPNSLWFGGDDPRFAISRPVDTTAGGIITFSLRIADGGGEPWERADLPDEGIVLEYSTDLGGTWTILATFDTELYFGWTSEVWPIPSAARVPAAVFRWRQLSHTGACCDHWALDDVCMVVNEGPPRILAQPQNVRILEGRAASFRVVATGALPLSYEWRKDGGNLPGANGSVLTLSNAQPADAGFYDVVVANGVGSVTSAVAHLTVTPRSGVVYLRAEVGEPWRSVSNPQALDRVLGDGNWQLEFLETANPAEVFSASNHFVFIDGSDDGTIELVAFLAAHGSVLQDWVAAGGAVFINAAPNEGSPTLDLGFGVTLLASPFPSTAVLAAALHAHPIFSGPFTPVGGFWSASFGHATVDGLALTALITNLFDGGIVLGEMAFGAGRVLCGGMTTPNFHFPLAEAANLRANILAYGATFSPRLHSVITLGATLGQPGLPVTVPIRLEARGDENALGFSLNFPASVLANPRAALGGDALTATLDFNTNQAPGRAGATIVLPTGQAFPTGAWEVLLVTFDVNASLGAATNVVLAFADAPVRREVSSALAEPLTATFVDGTISIVTGFEADVTPRPAGNGVVSVTDWVLACRFAAGLDVPTVGDEFLRADCAPRSTRGDGCISIADCVQAGRYAAALDPPLAAGGFMAPTCTDFAPSAAVTAPCAVRWRGGPLARGGTGEWIAELVSDGTANAVGFSLAFDPAQLTCRAVAPTGLAASGVWIVNTNATDAGRIGVALALPSGAVWPSGTNPLLRVTLAAAPGETDQAVPLRFDDAVAGRQLADTAAAALPVRFEDSHVALLAPPRLGAQVSADGTLRLQLRGQPGHSYRVRVTSDFVHWETLDRFSNPSGLIEIIVPAAREHAQRFYQAERE